MWLRDKRRTQQKALQKYQEQGHVTSRGALIKVPYVGNEVKVRGLCVNGSVLLPRPKYCKNTKRPKSSICFPLPRFFCLDCMHVGRPRPCFECMLGIQFPSPGLRGPAGRMPHHGGVSPHPVASVPSAHIVQCVRACAGWWDER